MKARRHDIHLAVDRRSTNVQRDARFFETRLNVLVLFVILCTAFIGCTKPIEGDLTPDPIATKPLTPEQRMRSYYILPPPPASEAVEQRLPYRPIAEKYNAWAGRLTTLWSRVDATIQYRDRDGGLKLEEAEGYLIGRPPGNVALSLGKLGQTGLWVGRNDTRYWMFELHDSDTAYVGELKNFGRPCSRLLRWPVQPAELPLIMGWRPLPVTGLTRLPRVTVQDGYATFIVPGTRLRYWVDPNTGRPARIEALGRDGQPQLICVLRKPVPLAGNPRAVVASRIEGEWVPTGERLRLELKSPTDGDGGRKVNDGLFNFDVLVDELKPDKTVMLDEGCQ